jgi:rubrerythrin
MNRKSIARELLKIAEDLSSVKTLSPLTERELARAIRNAIVDEENAVNKYETIVDSTDNEQVKKVLQSIADEERVHVGELQELLNQLIPDEQDKLDEGATEVEDES